MLKRLLSLLASSLLLAAVLAPGARADVLQTIKQKGVLTVGTKADYRPFGYLDPAGKIVDIVDPDYYASGTNVMALKSAHLTSWEQLRGKKVCLIQGSFYNKELQEKYGVDGVAFPGTAEAYAALKNGNCVAFAYDDTAIIGQTQLPDWSAYEMPLDSILVVPWGLAVNQGEKALADFMSKTITDWHKTGMIEQLEKKWGIKATKFAQEMHDKYK